jgi:hypothetical protein
VAACTRTKEPVSAGSQELNQSEKEGGLRSRTGGECAGTELALSLEAGFGSGHDEAHACCSS